MRFVTSALPSLSSVLFGATLILSSPEVSASSPCLVDRIDTEVDVDIQGLTPRGAPPAVRPIGGRSAPQRGQGQRGGSGGRRQSGGRGAGGSSGPGGVGTPQGFTPKGQGVPSGGDGPKGTGTPSGGGGDGPGGVGTPPTGGLPTGGSGNGAPGGNGGAGLGGGGGLPPLPGPGGDATSRNRRRAPSDDDWRNWWRLNELHELALDRRYGQRTLQAEPDRDIFLDGVDRGEAQPILGGADGVLRRAMPALQELVRHKTPRVRAEAVLAMGKIGGDGAVALIAPFVKESNLQVRKNAIYALGLTQSRRAFPHLRQVLRDPRSKDIERAYAAIALGLLGDKRGEKPLRAVIDSRSQPQEVRAAGLYALGHLASTTGRVYLEYFVLRPLEDPRLRAAALQGLAATGRSDLGKTYERLLDDPDVNVRRSAALAFGQIRFVTPYRDDLVAMEREFEEGAKGDAGGFSRRAKEEADAFLGALRLKVEKEERRLAIERDAAVNALARRVREDSDVMVRNFALLSLGRLGGAEAREVLGETLAGARIQSQKAFASLAIGLEGDADLATELRKILERGRLDPATRGAAAIALGLAGEAKSARVMMKLLRSSGDVTAIEGSVLGLGLLGYSKATTRLLELAKAKSRPELKREVGLALGLLAEDSALPVLGRRLEQRGPVIGGVAAAEALSVYPDLRALDRVVSALAKKGVKDSVQAACARAIGILGEKGETPVAADYFRNLNYLMRFQALNEAATL
jgi:HEAT repeat protein